MRILREPACDPISCPRPAPDVQHPVWARGLLAGTRLANTNQVFSIILPYSPIILQPPPSIRQQWLANTNRYSPLFSIILQLFSNDTRLVFSIEVPGLSRALRDAAGSHKSASGRQMAPQGAAGLLEPLINADRRSVALISSDQIRSALISSDQLSLAQISSDQINSDQL